MMGIHFVRFCVFFSPFSSLFNVCISIVLRWFSNVFVNIANIDRIFYVIILDPNVRPSSIRIKMAEYKKSNKPARANDGDNDQPSTSVNSPFNFCWFCFK